jgi:hypothetical protein
VQENKSLVQENKLSVQENNLFVHKNGISVSISVIPVSFSKSGTKVGCLVAWLNVLIWFFQNILRLHVGANIAVINAVKRIEFYGIAFILCTVWFCA